MQSKRVVGIQPGSYREWWVRAVVVGEGPEYYYCRRLNRKWKWVSGALAKKFVTVSEPVTTVTGRGKGS